MTSFSDTIRDRHVLIFGLGLQGGALGDARYCVKHGAEVRVTDKKSAGELSSSLQHLPPGVELSLGGHSRADIEWADIVLVNPGVPETVPEIAYAKERGLPLYNRTALFVQHAGIPVIGVTGTRGKSTTTELIYRILDSAYPGRILRGGNIPGISDLELLDECAGKEYAVLELSSFQLHYFHREHLSSHVAVITNLYPDHLNRYPSLAEYAKDKQAICAYQSPSDICIFNCENSGAVAIAGYGKGKKIPFRKTDAVGWDSQLPGAHNQENLAAAAALAKALGLDVKKAKVAVAKFTGLPFRQEIVREVDGVTYTNDTTSTTPTATVKAIQAATRPLVLIFGGDTKGLPYDELMEAIKKSQKIQKIIILGSRNIPEAVAALTAIAKDRIVGTAHSMEAAVKLAKSVSRPGWDVLLSPGFASFDLFENEFDRGRKFNAAVAKL